MKEAYSLEGQKGLFGVRNFALCAGKLGRAVGSRDRGRLSEGRREAILFT